MVSALIAVSSFKLGWYTLGNTVVAGFLIVFTFVANYHNRLERRMHRWKVWQGVKRAHLGRIRLNWSSLPNRSSVPPPDHPYAADLDIVGSHSLHRLLDTTVSTNGRARLSSWLLEQPADRPQWEQRQELARELARLPAFRDRLVVEGTLAGEHEINGERLQAVLLSPAGWPSLVPLLFIETSLALATAGLAAARLSGWVDGDYWMLSFGLYAFLFLFMDRSAHTFERALSIQGELGTLGAVLAYLERRAPYMPPSLRALCTPLLQATTCPSRRIRQAASVVAGLSVRANPVAHVLVNLPGPWDLYFTWRLHHLQSEIHAQFPVWLEILAEVEAASSLGTFAWLHPEFVWPRLADPDRQAESGGSIVAVRMGHPLIAQSSRVVNDVRLEGAGRIVLVTGSNMSGKSTFLRTVGINVCLAQAGAPVCAERFEWTWVRLRGCLRVTDSIEEGLSHFYAEVKRLKALLTAAELRHAPPVLFLIDEIFRGTNNRERLIGSRAYVMALSATPALGLVTTHDLELAELADHIPQLTNVHFEEGIEDGRLTFDYRLRPGPCPTTNALRIMALEGLPTSEPPPG